MPNFLPIVSAVALLLLLIQLPAFAILLSRLLKGPRRTPPLAPQKPTLDILGSVSVVVPTLNEAERISPLLAGLSRQSYELREVIVVDSNSKDGTAELVKAAQKLDPRFRVITDDPLPTGWVGRPWALHSGWEQTSNSSTWFLGMDADTQPHPGLIASLVHTAVKSEYDLISLSPQFILKYPGECWLQPALLMTLLYRFDPAGITTDQPERVMANGQCFLCRQTVLEAVGGYTSSRSSFCDDVTLARHIAASGFKVGFMDGAKVLKVRMYEGAVETWNEWGRSLDLKDASNRAQTWGDIWLLASVQGLPILIVSLFLAVFTLLGKGASLSSYIQNNLVENYPITLLLLLNLLLILIRFGMLFAIAPSYDRSQASSNWLFWLSPFADPLAVLRIILSALQKPKKWRGRSYEN